MVGELLDGERSEAFPRRPCPWFSEVRGRLGYRGLMGRARESDGREGCGPSVHMACGSYSWYENVAFSTVSGLYPRWYFYA